MSKLRDAIKAASAFKPKQLTVPAELLRAELPDWLRETLYCRTLGVGEALTLGRDGAKVKTAEDNEFVLRIFLTVFCDEDNVPVWDITKKDDIAEARKLVPFSIVRWFNNEAMIHNAVMERPAALTGNGVDANPSEVPNAEALLPH